MSKSSKNTNDGFSQEINKAIKKSKNVKANKYKDDKPNNSEGSKLQTGSSAGASLVGMTPVFKMKKLKKKKDIADDYGPDADENWMNFLIMGGFHPDVV